MPDRATRAFFDSSTLLYLASNDASSASRTEYLLRLGGVVSVQVLNEIANVAHRKMRMTWQETDDFLQPLREWLEVVAVTLEIHETGLALAARYQLSVYDGFVAAAALLSECDTLYSEDMHDGLTIERRLTILDPYKR